MAGAERAGISGEVIDAAFDLTTAVMAGIGQSMKTRYRKAKKENEDRG